MGPHVPIDLAAELGPAAAIVAASPAPMLLLDGELNVVAASDSFCAAFDLPRLAAAPTPLARLGVGEWDLPDISDLVRSILIVREAVQSREAGLLTAGGRAKRVLLSVNRVEHPGFGRPLALLLVTDVTAARTTQSAMDELLSYKTVLLQELQHRVANTMQMLAGILAENARTARSEETRRDLYDARQRIVSIWSLQKRLAESNSGEIHLRPYLSEICGGVVALVSRDGGEIRVESSIQDVRVDAEQALGLALIATELLINACRHAFPDGRGGRVTVTYASEGKAWSLTVADTGAGMKTRDVRAGVGTSIIRALAHHLHAEVDVRGAEPGTVVCISAQAEPG